VSAARRSALFDLFRRAAGYVAKTLESGKPADLPTQQSAGSELAFNPKTAYFYSVAIDPRLRRGHN
jgi:ABC-type uncharacterized transport system substrate-binding protein